MKAKLKPDIFLTEWIYETFGYYKYTDFKEYTWESFNSIKNIIFDVTLVDKNYVVNLSKIMIKRAGFLDILKGRSNITYVDASYTKKSFEMLFNLEVQNAN